MSEFFGSAWWLLVTLGILVTFHEFGHYWVARRCGVKVLRFSIGFGKPLWSHIGRDGVEYAIGAIPLGGYVKFLDAREADQPELVRGEPGEYSAAPVWRRIAIAAAGPAFNIAFTVFAFWAMFVIGRPDLQPIIGEPAGLAAEAGFKAGDRFTTVGGEKVDSLSNAMLEVAQAAMLHQDVAIAVIDAQGQAHDRVLPLSRLPADAVDNSKTFDAIGLTQQAMPAQVAAVTPDYPAARAGVLAGDRIVRINDVAIANWNDLTRAVGAQAAKNPHLQVVVRRGSNDLPLDLTAQQNSDSGTTRWMIGIGGQNRGNDAIEHYGPLQAVPAALRETWKTTRKTLGMIGSMLTGQASTKNLSSVITIAQVANDSAHQGLAWFLSFLAVISLSLGILNLLPIPILDGGHLLYYFIELIKGKPLSERALIAGQYVGLALLVTLMSLAFYNDIVRIVAS
jgi:regulator of sigma E protease